MAEASRRPDGPPSPKRARSSGEDSLMMAKSVSAASRSEYGSPKTGLAQPTQTTSPSWLPPLLPSHTTTLETVPHPAAPPYGRHGPPPHTSTSHTRPTNRASLANLINPDPNIGFSILQDTSRSPSRPSGSRPPSKSPKRAPIVLPPPNPHLKDTGYVYHNSYADDGGVPSDALAGFSSRAATNASGSRANSRDSIPTVGQNSKIPINYASGPVPPPQDPESYIPRDQAWFALGPRAEKHSDSWSVDRIGGYNEGFTDAVEAVKGGIVGVNGARYAKPVFWRPDDPQRSLLEADLTPSSSRPSSSFRRMSTSSIPRANDVWPGQYGQYHPPDYGPDIENRLSPRSGKRLPISCYPCRKRKLKCDGNVPCGPCIKRDSVGECGYEKDVRRRGKGKKQLDEADWLVAGTGHTVGLELRTGQDPGPRGDPGSSGGLSGSDSPSGFPRTTSARSGIGSISSRPFSSLGEGRRRLEKMELSEDESEESRQVPSGGPQTPAGNVDASAHRGEVGPSSKGTI